MTTRRRTIVAACAAAIAVVAPAALASTASQAASYRYWSYWLGTDSGWSFASVGPAFRTPADGTVEGWRFSVTGVQGHQAPGLTADFAAVCAGTPAEDGRKRVAVVVDPGSAADAPEGESPPGAWAMCVVAETGATGYDVLRAAATVRTDRGLICGIGGYPGRGCAEVVADPTPTPTPTPTPKPTKEPTPKPTPKPTKEPKPTTDPSRSPKPSPEPEVTSASPPASASPAPSTPGLDASTEPTPTRTVPASPRAEPASAARASTSAAPTPSQAPMPSEPAAATPSASLPTPGPTYSLLTAPLTEPPSDGGSGGALVAGLAVVGIAGLGGAAILRMRRGS